MGMKTMTKAQQIAVAARGVAARKGKGDRGNGGKPKEPAVPPTSEQMARGIYTDGPVAARTEKGQVVGLAYRRRPLFETIAKQPADKANPDGPRLIRPHQLQALRFYRNAWENMQASETRCALAVDEARGGIPSGMPASMVSDYRVTNCDRAMGALVNTMQAVALNDMSFSDVAMARYGSRERQKIVIGTGKRKPRFVNEIVPRSGRHREIIRDEFLSALKLLTAEVERITAVD